MRSKTARYNRYAVTLTTTPTHHPASGGRRPRCALHSCSRLLLLVFALSGCASPEADPATTEPAGPVVSTRSGPVVGIRNPSTEAFLGIPYAAAPIGALRFAPPATAPTWRAPRPAARFGPGCPQPATPLSPTDLDEDCLFLNVWRPVREQSDTPLPVMVWIHGGGFRYGSGNIPGALFAERNVIIVSVNYRLGLLGFVAHPAIEERSANFGLQDLVAALRWVEDNIAAFGGDPDNVTAFGVSAGAMAIHLLLTTPAADGLIDKAIIQSGYGSWPLPRSRFAPEPAPLAMGNAAPEQAEDLAQAAFARLTSQPQTLELLRQLPAATLHTAVRGFHRPVVDGSTIIEEPGLRSLRGQQAAVSLLTGGNSFEGSVLTSAGVDGERYLTSLEPYRSRLNAAYAADLNTAVEQFTARIFGDERYLLAAQHLARVSAAQGNTVYLYYNDFPLPDREDRRGAHHGSDALALLRGQQHGDPQVRAFSSNLLKRWVQFAQSGNPTLPNEMWAPSTEREPRWFPISDAFTAQPSSRVIGLADRIEILEDRYRARLQPALADPALGDDGGAE